MRSKLNWEYPAVGQARAASREDPIAIYEIREVPMTKRGSEFRVQVGTETGYFDLRPAPTRRDRFPQGFRDLLAAKQACQKHLNQWRIDQAANAKNDR